MNLLTFGDPITSNLEKDSLFIECLEAPKLTISSPGSQYPSCSMPALEPLQPTVRVSTTRPSFTAKLSCLAVSLGCMPKTRLRYLRRWRLRSNSHQLCLWHSFFHANCRWRLWRRTITWISAAVMRPFTSFRPALITVYMISMLFLLSQISLLSDL